ncbi:MAG: hypothetical protein ACK4NS_06195 [Saprospiraceae bacterium]
MSRKATAKLTRLLRAATSSEKRYMRIRLTRSRSGEPDKYLQLYEALAAGQIEDDHALIGRIYGQTERLSVKYANLKQYLYESLLDALYDFDKGARARHELDRQFRHISVLFKRGLYKDCDEALQKAMRIAEQYEYFTHQLEAVKWQKLLAYTRMDANFLHKNIERLQALENKALQQIQNQSAYQSIFLQLYLAVKKEGGLSAPEARARVDALVRSELFTGPEKALSHTAKVLYYRSMNLYYYIVQQTEQFHESGRQLIELLESKPHFLREGLTDYIAALSNYILSCGLSRRYGEVRATLDKLRRLQPITQDDRRKIHRQYYSNLFALNIYCGEFENAKNEMRACQQGLEADTADDFATASFFFQYACICFGCGDYDEALGYLNDWMRQPRSVEREDLQSVARIMLLIIYYESNKLLILDAALRASRRFVRSRNRLYQLERQIFALMGKLLNAESERRKRLIFRHTYAKIQPLLNRQEAVALIQTLDLDAWIRSKLEGQSFARIVRQKWRESANSA